MTFLNRTNLRGWDKTVLVAAALALAACASEDRDDTTGSRLYQAPVPEGQKPPPPIEAGDIAIAAQLFSHDIRQLPQVANITVPQLVQFGGVTSIVRDDHGQLAPVDTAPYTDLLRDRLLLGDREKLRFVERQLPAYVPPSARKGHAATENAGSIEVSGDSADFRVLAELRGRAGGDALRIQMEFVETHGGNILLNETYRIRPEAPGSGTVEAISEQDVPPMGAPPAPQPAAATTTAPVPGIYEQGTAPTDPTLPTRYNPPPPPQ